MVVQVLLGLHCVYTKPALDSRISKDICVVMVIQNIIRDMLNDRRCFFIVDEGRGSDDKLLRVILKLIEHSRLDTLQNSDKSFACQPGFIDQLSNQIILYIRICPYSHTVAGGFFFHKRCTGQ